MRPKLAGRASVPLMLVATLFMLSCLDEAGAPGAPYIGRFAVAPRFVSGAAGIVEIAQVRVIAVRADDESVVFDSTFTVPADADSLPVEFAVAAFSSSDIFLVTAKFITPAGDTAFVGGPVEAMITDPDAPFTPIELNVVYVGVGADAVLVRLICPTQPAFAPAEGSSPATVCPAAPKLVEGETLMLTAEAVGADNVVRV